jgi:ectoine hydroxylase-related dioxygenase (phytanoyl-CoA dioxygenase family)
MQHATQFINLGYFIEPSVLASEVCDHLASALTSFMRKRGRAGARHLMSNPAVAAVASDDRLLTIARKSLGNHAVPFRATLFEKSGKANWLVVWHQDMALPLESKFDAPGWGPWSEKAGVLYAHAPTWALSRIVALRVHLDASTTDNGPLRVVPGSQAAGVLADSDVVDYVSSHSRVECLVPRGGVLAMRPLIIHSSSKARSTAPRRVLHIEYANSLELEHGIRLAVA